MADDPHASRDDLSRELDLLLRKAQLQVLEADLALKHQEQALAPWRLVIRAMWAFAVILAVIAPAIVITLAMR